MPTAVPTETGIVHGPMVMECYSPFDSTRKVWPHHPGLYARYLPIDLTENNKHMIDPGIDLGWGVCRHGFGLQNFGDGYMTQEVAEARAKALNQGRPATDIPNRKD